MLSKLALIAVTAFAALAAASPFPSINARSGQCSTGSQYCCNSTQSASSPAGQNALSSLGILADIDAMIGLDCSPLSVVGIGSNSCTQQPTCCNGDSFNGAVVIGCSPISA